MKMFSFNFNMQYKCVYCLSVQGHAGDGEARAAPVADLSVSSSRRSDSAEASPKPSSTDMNIDE